MIAPPLQRAADAAFSTVARAAGVRFATDAFSRTREVPGAREDLLPLHARAFEVPGQARVARGYLWEGGEDSAVLLHGWRSESGSMYSLVEPVRGQGLTVAAFDAPGHGSSRGEQATITEYAGAAASVLATLGGVRFVIAHSLGAIAAAAAIARTRAEVAGVVLIAPTCTLTGVLERWEPPNIRLTRGRVDGIYRELHRRNGKPVSHFDVRTLGRDLTCPILAIHDPLDPVVPFSDSEDIALALPQTRIMAVPGRGHQAILVAPEVKRAIARFVADPGGAG